MSKTLSLLVLLLAAASVACERDNSYYCPNAPHHNCFAVDAMPDAFVPDAPPDVPPPCTGNQDCSGDTSVCDIGGTKMCVHCTATDHAACTGTTPTCLNDNVCRACSAHSQCDSKACLPDGSCGDDLSVAYVDPAGTGTVCTSAMPCKKVSDALATNRPYVKFHDVSNEAVTIDNSRVVTFLADPGAKLTRTSNGLLLEVKGTSQVTIYDLEISGASGPNNPGISIPTGSNSTLALIRTVIRDNAGAGISMSGGGTLILTQSTVTSNVGGGVAITAGQYQLTNNFITKNGGPASAFGGVLVLQVTTAGSHVFDFNTVARNAAGAGNTAGVTCALVSTPLTFTNSIVYDNGIGTQADGNNCSWSFSNIGPTPLAGASNIASDPLFVAPAQDNFHIQPTSPARDAADPTATQAIDIDGDVRPQGIGRDMGADEATP
ncbi:MAG: right-handed parallel beta-helix repeat-containing protein [Kofleriaceae bacterium]